MDQFLRQRHNIDRAKTEELLKEMLRELMQTQASMAALSRFIVLFIGHCSPWPAWGGSRVAFPTFCIPHIRPGTEVLQFDAIWIRFLSVVYVVPGTKCRRSM